MPEPETHPGTRRVAATFGRYRHHLLALVGWFGVTRVGYALAGVGFDTSLIPIGWHFIDPALLRSDPLGSIYYLHAQPPLLNVMTAVGLHAPMSSDLLFHGLFLVLGLVLTLACFLLLCDLAVPATFGAVATAVFVASPTVVLYENWYFSTYPTACALVVLVLCVSRLLRTRARGWAIGAGSSLAILGLTRATYHIVVVIALAVIVVAIMPATARRRALAVVVIPLVLVGGWYVKNWFVFGTPTASSWLGMNLAKITLYNQPAGRVAADVRAGRLSRLALVPPFSPVHRYPKHARTGHAVLDETSKGGYPNYDNIVYVDVSERYLDDALAFIRAHPGWYADVVGASFRFAFTGTATYPFVAKNAAEVHAALTAESRLLGQVADRPWQIIPVAGTAPTDGQIEWVVVGLYLWTIGLAARSLFARVRRRAPPDPTDGVLILIGCIVIVAMSANFFDLAENTRFRFETDPIVFVVAAFTASGIATLIRGRWRAGRAGPPEGDVARREPVGGGINAV